MPRQISQRSQNSKNGQQSLNMHKVLNSFKRSETKKAIIQNRISIMRINYERNQRKVQTIETQMQKLQQIKLNYIRDREEAVIQIRQHMSQLREKNSKKVNHLKSEKIKLPVIKRELEIFRQNETQKVKLSSENNLARIRDFRRTQLMEKQLKNIKVRGQQRFGKTKRSDFLNRKIESARSSVSQEIGNIVDKQQKSKMQLNEMRLLEREMIDKLSQSRLTLNNSRQVCDSKLLGQDKSRGINTVRRSCQLIR